MNNKDGLDEMQRERHNRIGNQMFTVMTFAFLINVVLYGAGIRLLEHPTDTMVIVTACSVIYLIRLIIAGAYKQPGIAKRKTTVITLILAATIAVVFAINLRNLPVGIVESTSDYSAYILMGVSVIGLISVLIAGVIKKKQDRDDTDD